METGNYDNDFAPKNTAQSRYFEWYFSGPFAISSVWLKKPVRFSGKQIFAIRIFYRTLPISTGILKGREIRITETYFAVTELRMIFFRTLSNFYSLPKNTDEIYMETAICNDELLRNVLPSY